MPLPRCPRDQTPELEEGSEEGLCGQTPTRGEDGVARRKWGVRRTMTRRDWWGEKSAGRAVKGTLRLAGVDPVFLSPKFSKPGGAGLGE